MLTISPEDLRLLLAAFGLLGVGLGLAGAALVLEFVAKREVRLAKARVSVRYRPEPTSGKESSSAPPD